MRQIYIRGDVGSPHNCHIYDAATDLPIAERIASMSLRTDASTGSAHADLIKVDGMVIQAEVVPDPARRLLPREGTRLLSYAMEAERDDTRSTTRYKITARAFKTNKAGMAVRDSYSDLHAGVDVADIAASTVSDPDAFVVSTIRRHFAEIGRMIADDLQRTYPAMMTTKPPTDRRILLGGVEIPLTHSGGRVNVQMANHSQATSGIVGRAIRGAVSKVVDNMDVCPDCKGSGRYQGFFQEEECSSCKGIGKKP